MRYLTVLATATSIISTLCCNTALRAEPNEEMFSPQVKKGEREIESEAAVARNRNGHTFWSQSLGLEYAFIRYWATEASINFGRGIGDATDIESFEWENRFQLTHDDDADYVIGFLFELARAKESDEGWEIGYGPLLQKSFGRLQTNLNLLLQRQLGSKENSLTELNYQFQLRWRRGGAVNWGVQGFGELGRWKRWERSSDQVHIIGPAFFARLGGEGGSGKHDDDGAEVEAGLLVGLTNESPHATLRLQAMVPF